MSRTEVVNEGSSCRQCALRANEVVVEIDTAGTTPLLRSAHRREPGSTVHRTRISATLWVLRDESHDLLSPYRTTPSNPGSSCWIGTNGVRHGKMEGLNDLRSATGKGWIGIGRPRVSWRSARPCAGIQSPNLGVGSSKLSGRASNSNNLCLLRRSNTKINGERTPVHN